MQDDGAERDGEIAVHYYNYMYVHTHSLGLVLKHTEKQKQISKKLLNEEYKMQVQQLCNLHTCIHVHM